MAANKKHLFSLIRVLFLLVGSLTFFFTEVIIGIIAWFFSVEGNLLYDPAWDKNRYWLIIFIANSPILFILYKRIKAEGFTIFYRYVVSLLIMSFLLNLWLTM